MSIKRVPNSGNNLQETPRVSDRAKSEIAQIKPSVLERIMNTISNLAKSSQSSKSDQPSQLNGRSQLAIHMENYNLSSGTNDFFFDRMGKKVDLG